MRSDSLSDGSVAFTAGYDRTTPLYSVERYVPFALASANLVSITITPASSTISTGATQRFIATGTYSDKTTQTLASVIWSSSNSAVASITNDATNSGAAFAIQLGSATIQACTGSICGSTALTVTP